MHVTRELLQTALRWETVFSRSVGLRGQGSKPTYNERPKIIKELFAKTSLPRKGHKILYENFRSAKDASPLPASIRRDRSKAWRTVLKFHLKKLRKPTGAIQVSSGRRVVFESIYVSFEGTCWRESLFSQPFTKARRSELLNPICRQCQVTELSILEKHLASHRDEVTPYLPISPNDDRHKFELPLIHTKGDLLMEGTPQFDLIMENQAVANLLSGRASLDCSKYGSTLQYAINSIEHLLASGQDIEQCHWSDGVRGGITRQRIFWSIRQQTKASTLISLMYNF